MLNPYSLFRIVSFSIPSLTFMLRLEEKSFFIDLLSIKSNTYDSENSQNRAFSTGSLGRDKMIGKIKSGQGTLIGNAGEYYVIAELLKRGVVAALAPRNAPDFDILATKDGQMVCLRVKTKSEEWGFWQWNARDDGTVFKNIRTKGDFVVLVDLSKETKNMQYFIAATHDLAEWLEADFHEWLAEPGKRGKPHSEQNKKRHLHLSKYHSKLSTDWDIIWR